MEKRKAALKQQRPRASVSAECFGTWNKREDFIAKVIEKDAETQSKLNALLTKSFMFKYLSEKDMNIVIGAMEPFEKKAGEKIITQGEDGNCVYVVESGQLDCTKDFGDGEQKHLKVYEESEVFGELALLYNCQRAASITCKTDCKLWILDRDAFNHIVKDSARK